MRARCTLIQYRLGSSSATDRNSRAEVGLDEGLVHSHPVPRQCAPLASLASGCGAALGPCAQARLAERWAIAVAAKGRPKQRPRCKVLGNSNSNTNSDSRATAHHQRNAPACLPRHRRSSFNDPKHGWEAGVWAQERCRCVRTQPYTREPK